MSRRENNWSILKSTKKITLNSYAKINLILNVLGKREDGYHEIESILQSISLADRIILSEEEDIYIECNHPQIPVDNSSLIYRTAQKILQKISPKRGVKIEIEKRIPVASGLAGGSANAATILRGINELYNLQLSASDLKEMGEELGMDVPFCLQNGTALAYHRGEKLISLAPIIPPLWIVLINPGLEISTQWAYYHLQLGSEQKRRGNIKSMLLAIKKGEPGEIARNLYNSFEELILKNYPEVKRIKDKLRDSGALGALMSGSGPSVFGIMPDKEEAWKAYKRLKLEYPLIWVVQTI